MIVENVSAPITSIRSAALAVIVAAATPRPARRRVVTAASARVVGMQPGVEADDLGAGRQQCEVASRHAVDGAASSGVDVATMMPSRSIGEISADSRAALAALDASRLTESSGPAAIRRSAIPRLATIHSSDVANPPMISAFGTTRSGAAEPVDSIRTSCVSSRMKLSSRAKATTVDDRVGVDRGENWHTGSVDL